MKPTPSQVRRAHTAVIRLVNLVNELGSWAEDPSTLYSVINARIEALPAKLEAARKARHILCQFIANTNTPRKKTKS